MPDDRWLLVCDIDHTILDPELRNPGLAELNKFLADCRDHVSFALSSGRSLDGIAPIADGFPICKPDWIIANVGTSLYSGLTEDTEDEVWRARMTREWGRAEIRAALADCPGLVEQESSAQGSCKLSYYFTAPVPVVLPVLRRRLMPWILSSKFAVTLDRYLDVMPIWGGKGAPVEYLALKEDIPRDRVVVCGDSGNDRDMISLGFKSIVVANHSPDLDDLRVFPNVYFAERDAALGVLEGLSHFFVGVSKK